MLYLVGGPPRMGKSTMAQRVLVERSIPFVSTDGLTVMLKPIGQPSFYDPQKSNLFFSYLDLFISRITKSCPDYLIEGDAFSPRHVKLLKDKYNLKCVFLTMTSTTVDNITNNAGYDKWTNEISAEHLKDLVGRIEAASRDIQNECHKFDINCFDLADKYEATFEEAHSCLLKT